VKCHNPDDMNLKAFHCVVTICAGISLTFAQGDGTPIVDQTPEGIKNANAAIIGKIRALIDGKKLLSQDEVKERLLEPQSEAIDLPAVRQAPLSSEEVAEVARAANLRVGYCYLCPNCDDWHINLAGGYAIAPNVVATCDHVIDSSTKMREGYLIAVDQDGNAYPVTSVIARSAAMDAALIRVEGADFKPLALNGAVRQGAAAFCYSSPLGQLGYFSEGIVNRFFWGRPYRGGDRNSLDVARHLRVNFSTDWAPGSSGSAVLDQAGNVIGHVSQIAGISRGGNRQPMITLHTGIPAHAVRLLAEAAGDPGEVARLAALEAEELAAKEKASTEKKDNNADK
jgi:hypothetical protein